MGVILFLNNYYKGDTMLDRFIDILMVIGLTLYIILVSVVLIVSVYEIVQGNKRSSYVSQVEKTVQVTQPKKITTSDDYLNNLLGVDGGEVTSSRYYME